MLPWWRCSATQTKSERMTSASLACSATWPAGLSATSLTVELEVVLLVEPERLHGGELPFCGTGRLQSERELKRRLGDRGASDCQRKCARQDALQGVFHCDHDAFLR